MLTNKANNIQPADLIFAADLLYLASNFNSLREAVSFIITAFINLFRAYCCSSLADFSINIDPLGVVESSTIKDSILCNEKLLLSVESAHNLPNSWKDKYKAFYIEMHLMYGTKSYGICTSASKHIVNKYGFTYVLFQLWVKFLKKI